MLHDLRPGDPQQIGPYGLRGVLGAGGMGQVYLGSSPEGRPVAVKVVRADLAADPDFRALFRREVEVARTVSGPFTAPVIDADLDGPVPWLATAYVAGSSLAEAVAERGPLPPGSVLGLARGLAEGLSAIHAAGVVHRDLKPSNVLLALDGPRLIDFGISRASGATALTCSGLMIGSPGFMSPEQAEGGPVGPPGDIFSLGAVLAFAAAGEGPFGPGSSAALIYRVIHRPPDLGRVPREVRGLVERCLVKDPDLRPTARDLLAATGAARSVTVRQPGQVTPAVVQPPPLTEAPEAITAPVLAGQTLVAPDLPPRVAAAKQPPPRPPQDRPQRRRDRPRRRRDRPSWRRHWRPLTAAAIVAGLLGGAAAADLALTAAHHRAPAAESERPVAAARTASPAISSADPRTSPSAAARKTSSARTPSSSRRDTSVRLADNSPVADTAPPMSANTPVTSMARPSQTASPSRRPYPSPSPSAVPSPSPSATPSPTSGGYGY